MRIAVAGKGGAGKTTFCATAARLLGRAGHRVVAIDGDPNPNLCAAIGAPTAPIDPLPVTLVSRRFDGPRLNMALSDVLERFCADAPDGVRVLRMLAPEHPDEGCLCSAHAVLRALITDLADDPRYVVLLDLEASPEHLSRGTARDADVLLLVVEPYYRSLEAARLQARLAAEAEIPRVAVVANKCRSEGDVAAIEEFCHRHRLELAGVVGWCDAALDADAAMTPLLDHAPGDPAVQAISATIEALLRAPNRTRETNAPGHASDVEAMAVTVSAGA